jgi:Uncharacterized conserved protein (DUF2075)
MTVKSCGRVESAPPNTSRREAEKLRCEVREFELEAQFRCAGSDAFVDWVNETPGIQRNAHVIWTQNGEVRKTHFAS